MFIGREETYSEMIRFSDGRTSLQGNLFDDGETGRDENCICKGKGENGMRKRKAVRKTALSLVLAGTMLVTGVPSLAAGAEDADQTDGQIAELSAETMNENMKLWYETPANVNSSGGAGSDWMQESLPLGNGNLGNLIFGGIAKERIHFNEKTLWTGGPSESRPNYNSGNKTTAYTDAEILEYRQKLDDKSSEVFPEYTTVRFPGASNYSANKGSYQDFGDIWLDYSAIGVKDSNAKNYRRELDLQTGIATTKFEYKGVTYTREHFVSSPDNVMVTRLTADKKGKLSVGISMELNNSGLTGTATSDVENNTYTIFGKVNDNDLKFRTTMKVIPEGGSIGEGKKGYEVKGANSILIIMAAETDYLNDYPDYRDENKDLPTEVDGDVEKAYAQGKDVKEIWNNLKSKHLADHQELFDRVSMDLGENLSDVPTNELVDNYRNGNYSTYLEVLSFQYGRYLSIAGSRGYLPSNLVGLWTVGPAAWDGDYHFNVNLQMNYWPVYVTNLEECGDTIVRYMESLREPGRETAYYCHGIEDAMINGTGFTVHTINNPFGMTSPTYERDWGWNPTGAAWAVQNIWQYYEFTQDVDYLRENIYPIMKEAALFWDNYLYTSTYQKVQEEGSDNNGKARIVVSPSFSAEQGPMAVGTTYDQSLVWELYKECIAAGEILGEDQAVLEKWQKTMDRLDPININSTGGIKEWYEETRVGTESGHHKSYAQAGILGEIEVPDSGWNHGHMGEHRHASHLVGLYPGTLINKENTVYMKAAVQSLEERDAYSTGWSKANKINLWARTGDGNGAYKVLNNLIGGNTAGLQYNLFDSHGTGGGDTMFNGGRVWQIDGNYGLTAGVAEMLIQSHMGYTEFLPAIPEAWQNGEVNGLKARGDFEIGQTWRNGLAESFTVRYDAESGSKEFTGAYENINLAKVTVDGEPVQTTSAEDGKITFTAEAGKDYKIDMMIDTSLAELKEKAENFLNTLHQDLVAVRNELQEAVNSNSSELGMILQKAQLMDSVYREVLGCQDDIYYMTTKNGLSADEIDTMYNQIRTLKKALLENTGDVDYYQAERNTLKKNEVVMSAQMENRVISFSRDSGMVSATDTVVLSKSEDADNIGYVIRYTTDGSQPTATSTEYKTPISMNQEGDAVVRAALFNGEQRVSEIYTRQYVKSGIAVDAENISVIGAGYYNNMEIYAPKQMVDGNETTRWASQNASGDVTITLNLGDSTKINRVRFDQFVSGKNYTNGFEIQVNNGSGYTTVYTGEKLGDVNGGVGNVDGGKHGYYMAEFDEVETNEIKVILKEGGYGEPSFFEIQPMLLGAVTETPGNAADLNTMIADANAKLAEVDVVDAPQALKDSFKESIADATAAVNAQVSQAELDSREEFLRDRYYRLGFGNTDKSVLEALILQARENIADEESYSRDSIYRLRKALDTAETVNGKDDVKQPEVDRVAAALQKALDELEEKAENEEIPVEVDELLPTDGWAEPNPATGFVYTITDGKPLSYTFTGNGVKATTVKNSDHGKLRVALTDAEDNEIYNEVIETYKTGNREDNAPLYENLTLDNGTYTITFTREGQDANAGKGYVEVKLSITQPAKEIVNRDTLKAEIDMCKTFVENTDYTEATRNELKEVLAEAEKLYDIDETPDETTCTTEMDDMADKLAAARGNLRADATELSNRLADAKKIKADGYTTGSFEKLQVCIKDVESFLNGGYTVDEVKAKLAALNQAITDLVVDRTSVQAEYEKLNAYDKDELTDDSKAALEKLLKEADDFLKAPDTEVTPEKAAQLLAKMQAFKPEYKVKLTELNKNLEDAKKIKADGYTKESYDALQTVIQNIETFIENGGFTQDQVNEKINELSDAVNALAVDIASVQAKYDELDKMDKSNLTEKCQKKLQKLLDEVKVFLDAPAEEAKPEDAAKLLKEMKEFKFDYKDGDVDTGKLEKELKAAEEIKADGYTSESYNALQMVIKDVKTFLAAGGFSESQVEAKRTELENAVKALAVDKASVQAKYDELSKTDKTNLTEKCRKKLDALLEEVKAFLDDKDATAEQAVKYLNEMNEFKFEYEESKPGTGDTDKPGTGDTDKPGTGDTNKPGTGDSEKPGTGGTGKPAADNKDAAVKTGDTSPIIPIAAAAIVSMLIIAVMLKRKRR